MDQGATDKADRPGTGGWKSDADAETPARKAGPHDTHHQDALPRIDPPRAEPHLTGQNVKGQNLPGQNLPGPSTNSGPQLLADISERIQQVHGMLSPQLRQAARYILAHPEDVALTSMRRLADHAGVKPSTMVRLARALNYDGYDSFREPYRQWLRGGESPFVARARTLQERGRGDAGCPASLLQDMVSIDMTGLRETVSSANITTLRHARDLICGARTVYVLGLRSCFSLASFFHYAYSIAQDNAVLLDGHAGALFDRLARANASDVALVMGFRPYTNDSVRATTMAADRGVRIVALTDSLVSPLAQHASQVLLTDTASPSYFQSLIPAMAQVQALLALVVAEGGETALKAISETERQLDAVDAYWHEPKRRRRSS